LLRSAEIEGSDGKRGTITLSSKGGGFYSAPFGFSTQAGQTYTVTIRYDVSTRLDVNQRVIALQEKLIQQWNAWLGGNEFGVVVFEEYVVS
jgi:hypothetical protein